MERGCSRRQLHGSGYLRQRLSQPRLVQDKEGHTLGIVTMEDVLEELVGGVDEVNEGGDDDE